MFVLKFFLCVSLKGTVTGIYWLASPTATLWLFPLTSGRLGRSSIRLTTTKRVSTAWPSRQRWTRLPPVETTGTHTHSHTGVQKKQHSLFVNKLKLCVSCCSIKIHELSELKYISNVVRLDDETKGEMVCDPEGSCWMHHPLLLHLPLALLLQVWTSWAGQMTASCWQFPHRKGRSMSSWPSCPSWVTASAPGWPTSPPCWRSPCPTRWRGWGHTQHTHSNEKVSRYYTVYKVKPAKAYPIRLDVSCSLLVWHTCSGSVLNDLITGTLFPKLCQM